jgi:hypothetical protein
MAMENICELIPEVSPADEFLEISNDFTDPKELIREGVSNAFDAGAKVLKIRVHIDKITGVDELVVEIEDDGEGLDATALKSFFGLGFSTRREKDEQGNKSSGAIGEKGHGTKIYFNSRRIEVRSVRGGKMLRAHMDEPRKTLRQGKLPPVSYTTMATDAPTGTLVTIRGYNENNQSGFGHDELRDYLYWFTKFGSFEAQLSVKKHENTVLHLAGLGRGTTDPELLAFGHRFPEESTNITTLKKSDKVAPLDYYVARWVFMGEPVDGMPNSKIDIVFYIEGDKIKRKYNPMVHEKYAGWKQGEYNVEQRYGLWLAKDFIPITRRNEWVSQKSEWTKYHAFVNSQDFRLTANRASVDNTPPAVLEAIGKTVKSIFEQRVKTDPKFQKYLEELEREQQYRDAAAEEKDFDRRKKAAIQQKVCKHKDVLFIEPRQEGGVFSLVMQLLAIEPNLFGFQVVDYDTRYGYDLLVTKDTALDLNRAALRFIEMKYELHRDFSHSFVKLASVICWDTKLSNEDTVTDLRGEKRQMKITPAAEGEDDGYTKFMLVSDTADHNIEVFVLKEFLQQKLKMDFRARTKE